MEKKSIDIINNDTTAVILVFPLTWPIKEAMQKSKLKLSCIKDKEFDNEEDDYYLIKLWSTLMRLCYSLIIEDNYLINIYLSQLSHLNDNMNEKMLENDEISVKVVRYIIRSTLYYAHKKLNFNLNAEMFEQDLKGLDCKDDREKGTLNGCHALSWYHFSEIERSCHKEIAQHIEAANNANSQCGLWHYINGLQYKHQCKDVKKSFFNERKLKHFILANKKCKNEFFKMALIELYIENNELTKALELYNEFKDMNVNSFDINLKLIKGFMDFKDFKSAKKFLDVVEKINPMSAKFFHYKGLYLFKLGLYENAAAFLKKAGYIKEYDIDIDLIKCLHIINSDKSFFFFENLLNTYKDEYYQIMTYLHMGMYMYLEKNNIQDASEYFVKAIKINPSSSAFEKYVYPLKKKPEINIFEFLNSIELPSVERKNNVLYNIHLEELKNFRRSHHTKTKKSRLL